MSTSCKCGALATTTSMGAPSCRTCKAWQVDTPTELIRARTKVQRAEAALEKAVAERDRVIVKRHAEGASLRTIADEAGVSHQTVVNIIRRQGA